MKYLINTLFILTIAIVGTSCKKEYAYPSKELGGLTSEQELAAKNQADSKKINLFGEFIVIDAVMYTDDNNTGVTTKENLFNPSKTFACMLKGGSPFDIDSIKQNKTTYSFYKPSGTNYGVFVLNEDTTKHYALELNAKFPPSIIESLGVDTTKLIKNPADTTKLIPNPNYRPQLMGGSKRVLDEYTTIDYDNKIVTVKMVEFGGDGTGVEYWTILRLRKIK